MTALDLARGGSAKTLRGAFMCFEFWHNFSIKSVDSGWWIVGSRCPLSTIHRPLFFFLRRKDNCDLHAFEARSEFGRAAVGQVFFEPVEQLNAEFLVGYLASTEPDRRLHLVPVGQNLPGLLHLEIVVVLVCGMARLKLLDSDADLLLLGHVRALLLLVKILAESNDATDRQLGLGRDFDQVIATPARKSEGLLRRHDPQLT